MNSAWLPLRSYISGNNTEGYRYRALLIYFPFKDMLGKADLIVWKLEWVKDDTAIIQITYQATAAPSPVARCLLPSPVGRTESY